MKVGLKKMNALHTYNKSAESTIVFIIISGNFLKKGEKNTSHLTNSVSIDHHAFHSQVLLENDT